MNILVVDDHPLVRKGITSTLSCEDNIDIVLEASNVKEAISIIISKKPNLAIVDLNLGKEDGLEIIKNLKNKTNTKFIILTSSIKKEDFIRSEEAGVDGYILKDAFAEDILYAIHVVLRGRKFIDPEITKYQVESTFDNGFTELTPREYDVLVELGKGLSNVEIAKKLFISEHTVKKHVSSILLKLQLNHRTQAALFVNQVVNL
jgi:two-component system nitrate/nitrite response regulator NarL